MPGGRGSLTGPVPVRAWGDTAVRECGLPGGGVVAGHGTGVRSPVRAAGQEVAVQVGTAVATAPLSVRVAWTPNVVDPAGAIAPL